MEPKKTNYSHGIDYENLETINGIRFTRREVDIIACLLSGKSAKTVAHFLSIEEKTVEAHKHNIMRKLTCNSKESIIKFIENSDKFLAIRKHYSDLLVQEDFKNSLREISLLIEKETTSCSIVYWKEQKNSSSFINKLETYLKLAGIKISVEPREIYKSLSHLIHEIESKTVSYILYVLPVSLINALRAGHSNGKSEILPFIQKYSQNPGSVIFLLREGETLETIPEAIQDIEYVDFAEQENHYLPILSVLKRILPGAPLERIVARFKERCGGIDSLSEEPIPKSYPKGREQTDPSVRSELPIPHDNVLLERSNLISEIDAQFSKEVKGIKSLALIGIGGSGKTTLARQYAHQQNTNLIWEINAETKDSLIESFEHLAYSLSLTEEDKEIMRELQEIDNSLEHEKRLIEFVKKKLRSYSDWFLIYDNVEIFKDIQKYFPLDAATWGQGRVILTTQDSNIHNNKYINCVIHVGELNENQKLILLTKIMNERIQNSFTEGQTTKIKKFLEEIPSFPLDVSLASYYIRTTSISCESYIELLKNNNIDLANLQEDILKDSGDYTKTRYSLVTLSLKKLIENHNDFGDLLLFISLLDSQNIPKDLLNKYKNLSIVDNFIYNLKKHSLITTQSSPFFEEPSISIHRSTQAIILSYLLETLSFSQKNILIKSLSNILEAYVEEGLDVDNLSRMRPLISHLKMFLNHQDLLTDAIKGRIESELGCIYFSLSLCPTADHFFQMALLKLKKDENHNWDKIAQTLLFQGRIHNVFNNYKKSESVLKESIRMYENNVPHKKARLALSYMYLGHLYKWRGEYKKAKQSLQKSLALYENLSRQAYTGRAMALAYLGDVYRILGNYNKSIAITEEALHFCKKYLHQSSVRSAWPLIFLGQIHQELGHYEKAIDLLTQGRAILEKSFSKKSMYASANLVDLATAYCNLGDYNKAKSLTEEAISIDEEGRGDNFRIRYIEGHACLGNIYKTLGNYEGAKTYLDEALIFYENYYGKEHIQTASLLMNLGQVYFLEGNLKPAEDFFSRAITIFQKNKHPNEYKCLENFANLQLKKYEAATHKKAIEEAEYFKGKIVNNLKKALEIVKAYFPEDAPHIFRIQKKLDTFKNQLHFG